MDVLTVDGPGRVGTATEFVAALRALCQRTELTNRQLEERARAVGVRLSRSTIARVLSGRSIPRPQTITSLVLACGGDRAAVQLWLAVRRQILLSERAVSDLAGAVESWLTTRWPARQPKPAGADLAAAVEAWLAARTSTAELAHPAPATAGYEGQQPAVGYSQGRLAEAVAGQTATNRWIGVHRRSKRRGPQLPAVLSPAALSRRASRPPTTGEYPLVKPRRQRRDSPPER